MSQNRAWRRVFPVFAVLAAFVLASLPAQAAPSRRAPAVAVPGESLVVRLWGYVVSLLNPGAMTKEGMSIDPDGHTGATTAPVDGGDDEGTSIDPNG